MKSIEILWRMQKETDDITEKTALTDAIVAMDRMQIPPGDNNGICPNCKMRVTVCDKYCRNCGQRLPVWKGWSE